VPLANKVAKLLDVSLTPLNVTKFSDGETYVRIEESIREQDVYIIQPTSNPVNDNLMELLLVIDALKRASAGSICAVVPFFGYARQDRKATSREPISAKLVANMIATAGATRVITTDLHAPQVQGFFDIPLDHLCGLPLLSEHLRKKMTKNTIVVAPDAGGIKMNRDVSERLGVPLVIMYKRRSIKKKNVVAEMKILGEVKGKNVLMIDDEINTGGTMIKAAEMLKKAGALDIVISATHGVFAGNAVEKFKKAPIKQVIVTDTIHIPKKKQFPSLIIVSIATVIAETIKIINQSKPMGVFLDNL